MNRIAKAFEGQKALIVFITGGDPDIETTERLILTIAEAGADMVEIGIPFSDPVAEGPVIQAASARALANGCTADGLFGMVNRLRAKTEIPLLFMTYANPVFVYGKERFMARCREVGIDGVIIPDVPFEERYEFKDACEDNGIAMIQLIAPTSGERAVKIAKEAEGFVYCVSSTGVTGIRGEIGMDIAGLIREIRKVSDIPCAVGFGISTPEQARDMAAVSDGVIVGSAVVRLVGEYGRESDEAVRDFIKKMKKS
jgi:tryptophan synthase alpha chain